MGKIIKINESTLQNIMGRLILERLGVPENILETAEEIYKQILPELQKVAEGQYPLYRRDNPESGRMEVVGDLKLNGNYRISDYEFTKINLRLVYVSVPHLPRTQIISMGSGHGSDLDFNSFRVKYVFDEKTIVLQIVFAARSTNLNFLYDAIDVLREDPHKQISVLSHELLHSYSNYKRQGIHARDESEYQFYNSSAQSFIREHPSLSKFLSSLYFINRYENLTRPSQVASEIRTRNITKSQFRNFLENNETYKDLKALRDYTYDDFRREFANEVQRLPSLPFIPQERMFNMALGHAFQFVITKKLDTYKEFLQNELLKQSSERLGHRNVPFEELVRNVSDYDQDMANKELQKYVFKQFGDKNYERFFENTIKMINFVAGESMKKLSKLYDMAKDDTKEPDIHSKINSKTNLNQTNEDSDKKNPKDYKITKEDLLAMEGKIKDIYWNTKK